MIPDSFTSAFSPLDYHVYFRPSRRRLRSNGGHRGYPIPQTSLPARLLRDGSKDQVSTSVCPRDRQFATQRPQRKVVIDVLSSRSRFPVCTLLIPLPRKHPFMRSQPSTGSKSIVIHPRITTIFRPYRLYPSSLYTPQISTGYLNSRNALLGFHVLRV